MNFQFYCPQGHLLQADSSASGSVISCPVCGTQFIIPAAPAPAVTAVTPVVSPATQPAQESGNSLDFTNPGKRKSVQDAGLDSLLGGGGPVADAEENPLAKMTQKKVSRTPKQETISTEETKAILTTATKKKKTAAELDLVHIPCPKGHVLDVDKEMLGERVQCPICRAVYDLKLENSLEYMKEKKEAEDLEEARLGKVWIVRAMIAGILLILFLLLLILT